jgi:oligopeptide transport system substrate-binding protein
LGEVFRGPLVLCLVLALAACGPKPAIRAPCPVGKLCLEYGNSAEPGTLDPSKSTGTWESHIIGDMIEGLTTDDAEGRPVPGMAKAWEVSPDGLTWTFHLRDAQWSDGAPVTADDFVYALRRVLSPAQASEYAALIYVIKNAQAVNEGRLPGEALGVEALDPHTLRISLEHPAPYLLELAELNIMLPTPKHVVEKWGDAWSQPAHYVSNGPYKMQDWAFGDHVRVVKNPFYYNAASVCFDQVTYYPTVDSVEAERRVRRGELDVNTDIQSNRIAFLRRPDQIPAYVRTHTWLGVVYVVFNTRDVPALRDKRVRLALDMAIDRDFIATKLLGGGQTPAYTFVPPGVADYSAPPPPAWAGWSLAKRQATARALLAQAGYGPGHPLRLEFKHRNTADPMLFTPAIQSDWKDIGVRADLAQEEPQIAYQDYRIRDFQVGDASWIADYDDPVTFLNLLQSATGAQNYGDYHNPAYDDLLAKADHEPDAKRRAAYLAQAESLMLNDAAIAPVYFVINKDLVNPRITGWVDNITDSHRARLLCVKGR